MVWYGMEWDFKWHRQKYLPVYFRLRPNEYKTTGAV